MRSFAHLYARIDSTTKTNRKLEAMVDYFRSAPPGDAAWAVYFLSGRKPKGLLRGRRIAEWACALADIPGWLFEECYEAVGDLAETTALLLPEPQRSSDASFQAWVEERLLPLREMNEDRQRTALESCWAELDRPQRFVWNKLLTGAFRVGVSQRLVTRAVAEVAGLEPAVIAHRMMGTWSPTAEFYQSLLSPDQGETDASRPYPFFLAHRLDDELAALGERSDWLAEWKWDGIRAQLIRRGGRTYLWSRGEELVTDRFPEIEIESTKLPNGTALDGEILAFKEGGVLPFSLLQRRIGRKTLGPKLLSQAPVVLMAFDQLEAAGRDLRGEPTAERRSILEATLRPLPADGAIRLSPVLNPAEAPDWAALARVRSKSRERGVEGLMLKRLDAPYGVGRERGPWWKWKIDPYTVDCVRIYAQRGHGRRAGLYTDYTFGVWQDGELTPFAKAYSGLTDQEIREVDRFVRRNTLERFGPVRAVKPELVFELAFENIQRSSRHKSGVAVRFPRMNRWRKDKKPADADTLDTVLGMIRAPD